MWCGVIKDQSSRITSWKIYIAILGIGQKFGTPWRPMEQGLVEGKHKEVQKLFGILVMDIMKCFPDEVSELLPCIEYMIYNTPGPHGYTPRDIDRRWSMKTPLERELHGVTVSETSGKGTPRGHRERV